ncbi:hypothetical protein [Endozoicomonas atrinae]|uniref:hypothetical protein n=1 Tax=Endozoicomonas atrinae TaxID=1333660 RepID=UPI001586C887|nr:hypothetical protein [Endozoicomonas atrinae]
MKVRGALGLSMFFQALFAARFPLPATRKRRYWFGFYGKRGADSGERRKLLS